MKIDLHLHTKALKKGERKERNIQPEVFNEKTSNVDIVSITNHNHFDLAEFKKISTLRNGKQTWPGIEVDYSFEDEKSHVILIVDPKKAEALLNLTENFSMIGKEDETIVDMNDLIEYVNEKFLPNEIIWFLHYRKLPYIPEENIERICKLLKEKEFIVFKEPQNFIHASILNNHGELSLCGSDHHNWEIYNSDLASSLKLTISTFEHFYLLAKKDNNFISGYLSSTYEKEEILTNIIIDGKNLDHYDVPIYKDLNVIFGNKGSGKSSLMKGISEALKDKGKNVSYYESSNIEKEYASLLEYNEENTMLQLDSDLTEQFDIIKKYDNAVNANIFEEIQKHIETSAKKDSVKKITFYSRELSKNTKDITRDYEKLKQVHSDKITNLENVAIDFVETFPDHANKDIFNKIIEELKQNHINVSQKTILENEVDYLTIRTLSASKEYITKSTGTHPMPNEIGFSKWSKNIINAKKSAKNIKEELEKEWKYVIKPLGKIDKGDVVQKIELNLLTDKSDKLSQIKDLTVKKKCLKKN